MVKPSTVLLNPELKREKASWTVEEARRMAVQITMTLEPNSLTVCSFLTSVFLSMLTTKLKKFNELLVKKSTQLRNTIANEGKSLGGRGCDPLF